MKRVAALLLVICLFFSGCSILLGGEHIWTQVHSIPKSPESNQNIAVSDYDQLYAAIVDLVADGMTQATISVAKYDKDAVESDAERAVQAVREEDPIAAYAVKSIEYTVGTGGGESVLALQISYLHGQQEIKKIQKVPDHAAACQAVAAALASFEPRLVLQIQNYEPVYFSQVVAAYALEYPQIVMEVPAVMQNVYPEAGKTRVVELEFSYTTSRDSLQNMLSQVQPVFAAASLYVSGDGEASEKYSQLYSFLVERFEYKFETSITPAYSLLRHGVGDSKAFATVYAAMCRLAGLECLTVSGTRAGESWYWNMVRMEDGFYHVDLLDSSNAGGFRICTDSEMNGYVWDYDAYPVSALPQPEPTEPATTAPMEE